MKKNNLIRGLMLCNMMLAGLLFPHKALTLEPKEVSDVNLNNLIQETQSADSSDGMTLVWWIPYEFWQVTLSQDNSLSQRDREDLLAILKPYFMLGVVQGEISNLGVAEFSNLEEVKQNLTLSYQDEQGQSKTLVPAQTISQEVEFLQNTVRPVLEQMMGNMGRNFHFLTFEDQTDSGERQISPYNPGTIQVQLTEKGTIAKNNFAIDLPLNSLYVPRICPNGKEAHISWQYCPWDGTKLDD